MVENFVSYMFRTISIISFAVTFIGITAHCTAFTYGKGQQWRPINVLKKLVHLFTLLFIERKLNLTKVVRKLVYLVLLIHFVILAVTGFYPRLVLGKQISGYWLMLHVTFAPVFTVCLAVLAVMWAHTFRFNSSDWALLQHTLQRIIQRFSGLKTGAESLRRNFHFGQKTLFWSIILLALLLILSIVLAMFPLFDTSQQKLLLEAHRYTALVFVLVAAIHTYLVVRTQMKKYRQI